MAAYLFKTLVNSGEYAGGLTQWQVYSDFLRHVVYGHPANRQQSDHDQWAQDVQRTLARIAYWSIERDEPIWHGIPLGTVAELLEARGLSIDRLPSAGLVEILESTPNGREVFLVFARPYLQEFLAASWAYRSGDRLADILVDRDSAKWDTVLDFLAGSDRGSVISQHAHGTTDHRETAMDAISSLNLLRLPPLNIRVTKLSPRELALPAACGQEFDQN
jgi:hypothetical protein